MDRLVLRLIVYVTKRDARGGLLGFFFQAEDGIRDLVRSRGLGDVYKRQPLTNNGELRRGDLVFWQGHVGVMRDGATLLHANGCLLYTSDAADERSSVDLGGRRIIKKKKIANTGQPATTHTHYAYTTLAGRSARTYRTKRTTTPRII